MNEGLRTGDLVMAVYEAGYEIGWISSIRLIEENSLIKSSFYVYEVEWTVSNYTGEYYEGEVNAWRQVYKSQRNLMGL